MKNQVEGIEDVRAEIEREDYDNHLKNNPNDSYDLFKAKQYTNEKILQFGFGFIAFAITLFLISKFL